MDIQQLQLVMDTLAQMGEQGKDAFIWWLFFDKAIPFLFWTIALPFVGWVVLKITSMKSEGEQRLRAIRDAMGIGASGYFCDSEFREIMQKINRPEM